MTELPTFKQTPDECRYVTTAIPYVNAKPHVGFALEAIQADCLARFYRAKGAKVRFQTGTDENSLKNVQAAEEAGVTVEEFVRCNADAFHALKPALNLEFDDFIRTSCEPGHRVGVEKLWRRCAARGDIYKREYTGLYCIGCEQFYRDSELVDGLCPEHGTAPEKVAEENYFFRLSRYSDRLKSAIETGELSIEPESRRNEILAWIGRGLEDFSVSRSSERARDWGIAVPGDPEQVIYVWFDALGNYITALGYDRDADDFATFWQRSDCREHIVGKGITRFHALYWPAMLLSAGLELPSRILAHGYVTVEGRKIGKSAGNTVDPVPLARELGADALRYYLLRHIRSTEDGDFSLKRLNQAYDTELVGQFGNLVHRVCTMIERYCDGIIPHSSAVGGASSELVEQAQKLVFEVEEPIGRFHLHDGLGAIWAFIAECNRAIHDIEPWSLAKLAGVEGAAGQAARRRLHDCLHDLAFGLGSIAVCLAPFLPEASQALLRRLNNAERGQLAGRHLQAGGLLFAKRDQRAVIQSRTAAAISDAESS